MQLHVDVKVSGFYIVLLYDQRLDDMGNVHEPASRQHTIQYLPKVRQLKRELQEIRREIGDRHDDAIERMRDTETRLLQAFYSFVNFPFAL